MSKEVVAGDGVRRKIAPKGHFVVYVGSEMARFEVPTFFLKTPMFQRLLDRAAEEYGFGNGGRIILPCDEPSFRRLASILSNIKC